MRTLVTDMARAHRDSEEKPEALRLWKTLSQYRNMHAHAGFDRDQTPTGREVGSVVEQLCEHVSEDAFWAPLVGEM